MKLYKYMKREHLEEFLLIGRLKIGTLLDYRKDAHGAMVSDASEGRKTYGGFIKHMSGGEVADNGVLSKFFQGGNITFTDCEFQDIQVATGDLYIYSTSKDYSLKAHKRWAIKEGYDACLAINLHVPFFAAISNAIRLSAHYLGLHNVTYHPTETIDITSPLTNSHPALLKFESDYGDQNEMRAIWSPKANHDISPMFINVINAVQYCLVHKILNRDEINLDTE